MSDPRRPTVPACPLPGVPWEPIGERQDYRWEVLGLGPALFSAWTRIQPLRVSTPSLCLGKPCVTVKSFWNVSSYYRDSEHFAFATATCPEVIRCHQPRTNFYVCLRAWGQASSYFPGPLPVSPVPGLLWCSCLPRCLTSHFVSDLRPPLLRGRKTQAPGTGPVSSSGNHIRCPDSSHCSLL